jgi:hypothetical protein
VALRTPGCEVNCGTAGDGFVGAAGGGVDTFGSGTAISSIEYLEAASAGALQGATYAPVPARARQGDRYCDALNGIAWADDAQIAHINVVKYFAFGWTISRLRALLHSPYHTPLLRSWKPPRSIGSAPRMRFSCTGR